MNCTNNQMNWKKVSTFLKSRGHNEMRSRGASPQKVQMGQLLYILGTSLEIGLEKEKDSN